MVRLIAIASLMLMSPGQSAQLSPQFVPETGMYTNSKRSGEGAFIEVQGDVVAMAFFTHTQDGDSIFYTAAGYMFGSDSAEANRIGYLPVGRVSADLYRTEGGPVLGSLLPGEMPYAATKVGRVGAEFGYLNSVTFYLEFDTAAVPSPVGPPYAQFYLERAAFGLQTHGTNGITGGPCWPDFLGEWVFIDRTDPDAPPLRLNLTERTISPPQSETTCGGGRSEQILTFRDVDRDTEMRCVHGRPDPLDGVDKTACELRVDGSPEPLFWVYISDMTPTRVVGSKGSYLPLYARTTETVLGIRIQ